MAASVGATAVLPSAPGNLFRGIVNCFIFNFKKKIEKTAISKDFVCNKLCGTEKSKYVKKNEIFYLQIDLLAIPPNKLPCICTSFCQRAARWNKSGTI